MAIDRASALRNAEKFIRQGKIEQAIVEYARLVDDQPDDWTTANTLGDLYVRSGQPDKAAEQFSRLADGFHERGFTPKAAALYRKVLKIKPDAEHALRQAAEIAAAQELLADARAYLKTLGALLRTRGDAAGAAAVAARLASLDPNDVDARLDGARALLADGHAADGAAAFLAIVDDLAARGEAERRLAVLDEAAAAAPGELALQRALLDAVSSAGEGERAAAIVERFLTAVPDGAAAMIDLIDGLPITEPSGRYRLLSAAAEFQAAAGRLAPAIATYQAWIDSRPGDVAALSRVIELAVDAGLDAAVTGAQEQLADTYLATGRVVQARFIAEDLVLRDPQNEAHRTRLRVVREQLGELPASVAAPARERALEPSPERAESSGSDPAPASATLPVAGMDLPPGEAHVPSPVPAPPPVPTPAMPPLTDFGRATPIAQAQHRSDGIEIDLSVVLDQIQKPIEPADGPVDLDDVFAQLRDQARRRQMAQAAEQEFRRGIELFRAGQIEACLSPLEAAARAPSLRFATAAILGRIHLRRGQLQSAIQWLERAAEAPPRTPADGHAVLYDLADTLESVGDQARALAVFLQLQADAGAFRDVPSRVARLSRIGSRG